MLSGALCTQRVLTRPISACFVCEIRVCCFPSFVLVGEQYFFSMKVVVCKANLPLLVAGLTLRYLRRQPPEAKSQFSFKYKFRKIEVLRTHCLNCKHFNKSPQKFLEPKCNDSRFKN